MIIYGYGFISGLFFDVGSGDGKVYGVFDGVFCGRCRDELSIFKIPCDQRGDAFVPGDIWQTGVGKPVATTDGRSVFDLLGNKTFDLVPISELKSRHLVFMAHQMVRKEKEQRESERKSERERERGLARIKAAKLTVLVKCRLSGVRINSRERLEISGGNTRRFSLELDCGSSVGRSLVETYSGNEWSFVCETPSILGSMGIGYVDIYGSFWACIESIHANYLDISEATLEVITGSLPFEAYQSTLALLKQDQYYAAKENWQRWKERFF